MTLQEFKASVFKALAHPTRIRILELLRDHEMTVSELCEAVGLDISNVSQHLSVLRNKGILEGRKEGQTIYYQVRNRRLYEVLDLFREWFTQHLQSHRDLYGGLDEPL